MKKFHTYYLLLTTYSLSVFAALTAQADTQTWSGTQSFDADVVIYDPVELDGEVTVSVASGKTVIISNAVSDVSGKTGKINLVGGGTLTLANANTFTGGAYIDTGVLQVTTGGALGTGDITIKGGTAAVSQLHFGQLDPDDHKNKTITFANNITVESSGDDTHYQIVFGPHWSASSQKTWRQSLCLAGNIVCSGDLYISLNNSWSSGSNISLTTSGRITAKKLYFDRPSIGLYIRSELAIDELATGSGGFYGVWLYNSDNRIMRNAISRHYTQCIGDNVLGGAAIVPTFISSAVGGIVLNAYTQTVAYLQTVNYAGHAKYLPYVSGTAARSSLTLTGGVANAVYEGKLGINTSENYVSVTLNPSDAAFTQAFSNSVHTTRGTMTVQRGNMIFGGATTLTNLSGIVVNGGSFTLDTTDTGDIPALKSLSSITVKYGAKLTLKGANLFGSSVALNIERGAELDIPSGQLNASTLKVDGYTWAKGTYTHSHLEELPEGVTLNVASGEWGAATSEAVWTGEGADNYLRTAGNWKAGEVPALDGSVKVILTNGTVDVDGIKFKDGDWLNGIENRIDVTFTSDSTMTPFVLEPEKEGDALWLSRGFKSDFINSVDKVGPRTQVKVRGTLKCPCDSVGGDNQKFFYLAPAVTEAKKPKGVLQPTNVYGDPALSLVLDGATIDMPAEIAIRANSTSMFSTSNSMNVFTRPVALSTYAAGISADSGSVIRFCGGVTCGNCYHFYGPGEYQILTNRALLYKGFYLGENAKMVLDAEGTFVSGIVTSTGKTKREGFYLTSGTLEFRRNNCFSNVVQIVFDGNNSQVVKFNLTTQQVGNANFVTTRDSTYIHGEYPSMLEITGKMRDGAITDALKEPRCTVKVKGGLGFHYSGTNEFYNTFTLAGRAFESCGDLVVSEGTMELASGASWLNGTNFTARGKGTLKLAAASQINEEIAALHLAESGKVELPSQTVLKVASAETNGVALAIGTYTSEQLGGFITDDCTLKVGKLGTTIMLW